MLAVNKLSFVFMLPKLAALLLSTTPTLGQRLPTRDEELYNFQINNRENFFDTKSIPDGQEVIPYLFKNETASYYFLLEEDDIPLSITITPCASPVQWSIAHRKWSTTNEDMHAAGDNMLQQQQNNHIDEGPEFLTNGIVDKRREYITQHAKRGLYVIAVTSIQSDSYITLYATTTPDSDRPYPELPTDAKVKVKNKRRGLSVTWNPSPTNVLHKQGVKYCLVLSTMQNITTHCRAKAFLEGDKPPVVPKYSGFGFSGEKESFRELRRKANPVKATKRGDITYKCVGTKTRYTFKSLTQGQKYFINVFVVSSNNKRSTAYEPVTVSIVKSKSETIQRLRNGKPTRVSLTRVRSSKVYRFDLRKSVGKLSVSVLPCRGSVRLEISGNGIDIISKIRNLKTVTLKKPKAGTYIIKVFTSKNRRSNVRLVATTRSSKYAFPKLPKDTRIKIWSNLVTCDTVTLTWMGTDAVQNYCLYQHEVKQKTNKTDSYSESNQCFHHNLPDDSEKIRCKNFKHKQAAKAVITEKITGLKPHTDYVYQVYVSRRGRNHVAYNRGTVRTKSC